MGMGKKERKELVSATISQLEEVLPASGKPEELVKLTTAIVQGTKKLLDGIPEDLQTKSTSTLSEFVVAARLIAKDPRSVDAAARRALSNSRKAVDALVRELNSWHDERQGEETVSEDVVLDRLASETTSVTNNVGAVATSPTKKGPSQDDVAKEKELRDELRKEQITLWKKTEPQQAPVQHGKPSEALTETTEHLKTSASALVEAAGQKTLSPVDLLEPVLQLTRSVSVLLDLVDSLFVNRYPMRSQVHGFCCTLVEKSLVFGSQSRTDDASSLRTIATEVPALLSAAEVMITQSHKRAEDMEGQKKMSMQRSSDLQLLSSLQGAPVGVKKRGTPPKPPGAVEKPKAEKEFEIICVLCTNVAVNQENKTPMPKGSEVHLLAYSSTNILDVRRMLHTRTGIPRDNIEIKLQGDDVLPDATRIKPDNPVPYFVFNIHEPSDKELQEMRKIEKLNSRPKLEDLDWNQFSGPVAIALYDYDALGEEGNLNFDEGEVIEVMEKSHDGWWRGQKEGVVGDFPASFVEEIEIPRTKEEAKRLAQRFGKKSPDKMQQMSDDDGRSSPSLKKLRKLQSNPEPNSPSASRAVFDRRVSEPVFSEHPPNKKDRKKLSLFKKRTGMSYGILQEEPGDIKKSPLLVSDRRKKKVITSTTSWEDAMANCESPEPQKRAPLIKPISSPKITTKQKHLGGTTPVEGSAKVIRPRRPPPPVPNPQRATHVSVDTDEIARRGSEELSLDRDREGMVAGDRGVDTRSPPTGGDSTSPELQPEEGPTPSVTVAISPSPDVAGTPQKSESMEELLKNLEEFDEVISSQNDLESPPENEERERDFATIPRSELPITIKPSDESRKSKSPSRTPEMPRKPKPNAPKLVQNGLSPSDEAPAPPSKPTAPPRRKKNKMSQRLKDRVGVFESSDQPNDVPPAPASVKPVRPAPKVSSPSPPPKPERDEKKRMKTRLEVMATGRQQETCTSAPVSRNASPDITENKLSKEGSASSEALDSRSSGLAKRSPPFSPPSSSSTAVSYSAALQCISYLSDEDRIQSESLFKSSASSSRRVSLWLSRLDKGEAPDLSSIPDTGNATALLKALLAATRLGPLIQYPLAKSMCDLVKSTSPVSVLGSQLEQLTPQHRELLKELLRWFGQIINYSHQNMTEVTDLNRMFGSLIFDRLPPVQTEQLLAYLISTCELLIIS